MYLKIQHFWAMSREMPRETQLSQIKGKANQNTTTEKHVKAVSQP